MYNLFVTNDIGKWDASYFTYEIDRVFEYTLDSISKRYKRFNKSSIDELIAYPSLFAYERQNGIDARVGWINSIKATPGLVTIEHELDSAFPPIPASALSELGSKLDILKWEMNRTHWALKNKDLLEILFEAGLIKHKKPQSFRVFLCHASEDKEKVEALYQGLVKDGIDAWFDKKSILPGQDWELEIHQAIKNSDAILVCLSSKSTVKEGYVQKEMKMALDIADEKPDRTIFVIPTRLEDCEVPEKLNKFHWADMFLDDGYENLYKALKERANSLGIRIVKST